MGNPVGETPKLRHAKSYLDYHSLCELRPAPIFLELSLNTNYLAWWISREACVGKESWRVKKLFP